MPAFRLHDAALQAELRAYSKRRERPLRFAVIFALTKRSNGFYDQSNGCWEWNRIPETATFKDREVAEAVANVLTMQRRLRRANSVIFAGPSRPLQVVALRKTLSGYECKETIRGRHASFTPTLPRYVA